MVDQVVNLVSSLVEPLLKVANPVPSWISPTFHLKSETQVTDPVFSSVNPTLHLKHAKVVDLVLPSVDPTAPLRSVKETDPVPSSVSPTLHSKSDKVVSLVTSLVNPTPSLKSAQVVNLIPSSINPTLPLESKANTAHVFLVDTKDTMLWGIPLSAMKPPPSNEAILFDWGALTGPCLPSHIPF
jgi:hypothetical protein